MAKSASIINIFTYKLPYKISNQIYTEYQNRRREALFLVQNANSFKDFHEDLETIELLLAMSIFYKRVIANLQGAVNFHSLVNKYSGSEVVQLGSYRLNGEEKNMMLGVIMDFNSILQDYGMSLELANYSTTRELLHYKFELKTSMENGESNNE